MYVRTHGLIYYFKIQPNDKQDDVFLETSTHINEACTNDKCDQHKSAHCAHPPPRLGPLLTPLGENCTRNDVDGHRSQAHDALGTVSETVPSASCAPMVATGKVNRLRISLPLATMVAPPHRRHSLFVLRLSLSSLRSPYLLRLLCGPPHYRTQLSPLLLHVRLILHTITTYVVYLARLYFFPV